MSGAITQDAIKSNLVAVLIEVCKLPREKIEYDIPVSELGVDSVEVAGLFSALEQKLKQETGVKLDIDPTITWEYPTINKLAAYLEVRLNLVDVAAQALQLPPETIRCDIALSSLGLNPGMVTELFAQLGGRLKMNIDPSIVRTAPTIDDLASRLAT